MEMVVGVMDLKHQQVVAKIAVFVGLILFLDEVWMFGIPFGGWFGDMSRYDLTGSPVIHHWMLGLALLAGGLISLIRLRHKK